MNCVFNHFVVFDFVQWFETVNPCLVICWFHAVCKGFQRSFRIAVHSERWLKNFSDFGTVNFYVNDFRLFCEFCEISRYAAVKTKSYANNHIGFVGFDVRCVVSMHSEHSNKIRMVVIDCVQTHYSRSDRNVCLLRQSNQFILCLRKFHTMTSEDDWLFCVVNQLDGFVNFRLVQFRVRIVATNVFAWFIGEITNFSHKSIFRNINQNWTWTTCTSQIECLGDDFRNFVSRSNLVVPFGDRHRYTNDVNFLKLIGSQRASNDLCGDCHDRR